MSDSFWLWTLWLMLIVGLSFAVYTAATTKDKKS